VPKAPVSVFLTIRIPRDMALRQTPSEFTGCPKKYIAIKL